MSQVCQLANSNPGKVVDFGKVELSEPAQRFNLRGRFLGEGSLCGVVVQYEIVVPCQILAVDVLFWRAAFVRDEMVSLVLLVVATVGGFLAWEWSLHKTRVRRRDMPKERGLT